MTRIFLHGMGGRPEDWEEVREQLRDPGEAWAVPAAPSLEECARALASRLAEIPSLDLCGYSMGGRIALLAAEQLLAQGKPPHSIVLLGAGLGFSDEEERQKRRQIDQKWARLAAENIEEFWRQWYSQPLFQSFTQRAPAEKVRWLERKSMDFKGLVRELETYSPAQHPSLHPLLLRLRGSPISVLYIAGELDKKYLTLGRQLQENDGIPLEIISGAGHLLPLEAPTSVAERLERFWSANLR